MHLTPHPFLSTPGPGQLTFPPQLLHLSQKNEDWKKACMDGLEGLGRSQLWRNAKLMENYRMSNGQFLKYQYMETDENEYISLVQQVQDKFNLEIGFHHYDFLSQILNTLIGELEAHPDGFRAKAVGDVVDNARSRKQSQLLKELIDQQIEAEIQAALVEKGFDTAKTDFASQQESSDYQQQIQAARTALTPAEIKTFMSTKWQHVAEIWANITLADSKKRFDIPRKLSLEFRDSLNAAVCFRHFYLTGTGYSQETWNPARVFYEVGEDETDIEKGNKVGQVHLMGLSQVIDKFGHKMSGKQLEELYGIAKKGNGAAYNKDWYGNRITYTSIEGNPYATRIPWNNPVFNELPQVSQADRANATLFSPLASRDFFQQLSSEPTYQVTEGYWKSQKRIGRLSWYNPETGTVEKALVDETVVLPPGTKEKEGNLTREDPDDYSANPTQPTIEWTWINEVWQGIKIAPVGTIPGVEGKREPLYLDVKPLEFQGKPDAMLYDCELPVVGTIFNARNARSQSLVDRIKPFQIAHNLFMNQAYRMAEEQVLPFLLMDVNAIPTLKDWGGREGFEKWMESLRSLHLGPLDTRPDMMRGANAGGALPKVIDLDFTRNMITNFDLAMRLKQMGLDQVGISPQRMGDVKAEETATGVSTGVQRSYIQTAPLFSAFYNYVGRCYKKDLDFALFTQATDRDMIVSAIHSDYTESWLKLNGLELLLAELRVYVSNSQKDVRDLEITRQLALQNTSDMPVATRQLMATSDSMQQIQNALQEAGLQQQQQAASQQNLESSKLQTAERMQESQQAFEAEQNQLDRDNRLQEAYIKTYGYGTNASVDADSSGVPDALEYAKFAQTASSQQQKAQADAQKGELARLKLLQDQQKHQDGLSEAAKDRNLQRELAQDKIRQARIQGDKSH